MSAESDFYEGYPKVGDTMNLQQYGEWVIVAVNGLKLTLARSDGAEMDIELQANA